MRDRQADRLLERLGYRDATVFYSPAQSVAICWMMFLTPAAPLLIAFLSSIWLWSCLVGYALLSYLFSAARSHCFAVTDTELIIVNSNVPFRRLRRMQLQEIRIARFEEGGYRLLSNLLLCFGRNMLTVCTAQECRSYPCIWLEQDAFDENWTDRTIEDLDHCLQVNGVPTEYLLTDT